MNLKAQLTALKTRSSDLTLAERAELSCRLAKQFEKAGEYEEACEALAEFWPERHGLPILDGLDDHTKGLVLLRVGALAGWLGSADQTEGSQETAKDLITRSIETFEKIGESVRATEARADLALCYWREGGLDEARIHLTRALDELANGDDELKAVTLVRAGMVEIAAQRLDEALSLLNKSESLLEESTDNALRGTFHNLRAVILNSLGTAQHREDYIDRSLIEYAAASVHFEQAGHTRYQACVENNLGFLFFTLGKFAEAHKHLARAGSLFLEIHDNAHLAQVNDTRARTLLAEGRLDEAAQFARSAVKTLERGGEQALLAEALTTYGVALAHTGRQPSARIQLHRAIEVAETVGDLEGAGRAQLTLIEELGGQISAEELEPIYRSARDRLKTLPDPSTTKRLLSCADKLIDAFVALESGRREPKEHTWEGFSFKRYVHDGERAVIERALRDSGGSVTRAARLLGFRHHQSLISLINSRHQELLKARSTVRRRRQHLFSKSRRVTKKARKRPPKRLTSQVSILQVEDNQMVAKLLGELLAAKDWRVELCTDVDTALRKLTGSDHYDVLVIDNDLPGLSGLELAERASKITHRRTTPIIMLSGDDIEKEAWRAGADEFLRKPEGIDCIASTVERLLESKTKKD